MKEKGYFNVGNIGKFWLISGTRPYIRQLAEYAYTRHECSSMKAAAEVCREMLKLCENDNLGMRYMLIHIYAYLEDEESALELVKQYPEDNSTQVLLPMSVLYYKLGNYRKATSYLHQLTDSNKDTFKFFDGFIKEGAWKNMSTMKR